jgi:hypothetical protein
MIGYADLSFLFSDLHCTRAAVRPRLCSWRHGLRRGGRHCSRVPSNVSCCSTVGIEVKTTLHDISTFFLTNEHTWSPY